MSDIQTPYRCSSVISFKILGYTLPSYSRLSGSISQVNMKTFLASACYKLCNRVECRHSFAESTYT